ncbi:MAG: winged helix-turn-helix transcriptional regulator [Spirochaetes bacterium]|nr:winged helix-turn-helix transcriptional regulator [Spirochaetota bacterium]
MKKDHVAKSSLLKALGHPVRFCIVDGLLKGQQNVATMVDCTGVPQPTVSQHLSILKAAGVLCARREGNQMVYSVCSDEARKVMRALGA